MKAIFVLVITLVISSCGEKAKHEEKKAQLDPRTTRSYEFYGKDTINRTDVSGNKQGHWETRKPVACTKTVQAIYTGEPGVQTKISNDFDWVKLEEGDYVDNKKEGLWKSYYPSGRVKDSVVYKNDAPVK